MIRKLLLFLFLGSLTAAADAQRKEQKTTAYAITANQKGSSSWTEVRLIDIKSGEVIKTIYTTKDDVPTLNARTRKPIAKKEAAITNDLTFSKVNDSKKLDPRDRIQTDVQRTNDVQGAKSNVVIYRFETPSKITNVTPGTTGKVGNVVTDKKILIRRTREQLDKPFSTTSAACAYDQKHGRLYYTPIGINELRYIDLQSKSPSIYYFENEPFGALTSRHDVPNQITRMVIAADGNGYALTNNGKHLIRFTTNKKHSFTDLGELTNDPANGRYSVHSSGGYGGDMIADDKDNLYLITANRLVFKISIDTKVASYIGTIKGLPGAFSTNGAVVEKGTSVIVSSANSTLGYYRFDIQSLEAEKVSAEGPVFNASDLANGNLVSLKKKKASKTPPEKIVEEEKAITTATTTPAEPNDVIDVIQQNKISVYPNPVAMGGVLRVAFKDQPAGMYSMQFIDIAGKLISAKQVNISNRHQVEEYALPELTARGNYLLKVLSDTKKVVSINKVIIQ